MQRGGRDAEQGGHGRSKAKTCQSEDGCSHCWSQRTRLGVGKAYVTLRWNCTQGCWQKTLGPSAQSTCNLKTLAIRKYVRKGAYRMRLMQYSETNGQCFPPAYAGVAKHSAAVSLTRESIPLMMWSDFLKLHNNTPTNKRTCLSANMFLEIDPHQWRVPPKWHHTGDIVQGDRVWKTFVPAAGCVRLM